MRAALAPYAAAASSIPPRHLDGDGGIASALVVVKTSLLAVANPSRSRRMRRPLVFTRRNYILIIAGVLAVVLGYALMAIENALYGFISLYVAPIIILAGYLEIIYAIVRRPDDEGASSAADAADQ
jgi:predicted Co/Zn/Cd cation transporter (cation efflux family)